MVGWKGKKVGVKPQNSDIFLQVYTCVVYMFKQVVEATYILPGATMTDGSSSCCKESKMKLG